MLQGKKISDKNEIELNIKYRKSFDSKKSSSKSSKKRSTINLNLSNTTNDHLDSSLTISNSKKFYIKFFVLNFFFFLDENNKRARKRQRTDSIEKLKTFENKVVIEIKLPNEIKMCLSRDWHLINNENKVKKKNKKLLDEKDRMNFSF